MNIRSQFNNYANYTQSLNNKTNNKPETTTKEAAPSFTANPIMLKAKYNDHLLSFGARVDKGLDRFYDTNKDRMPATVSRYLRSLEDKSRLSPLEAQRRAFIKLEGINTVKDIKKAFPDEELFSDLVEVKESKATRGLLQNAKENEELLALDGKGVLKDKSDLTVYLVKKVFLEGKTIDEINNDLENDLNDDFKADFKFKNKNRETNSQYVYGSTLKSLGIKVPEFEYMQSLRYTKEGYSDSVGERISQGQRAFWDSLEPEQRTARAKKSTEKFEIWWNSFSQNQKLDLIASQMTELEMLKDFKKAQRAQQKQNSTQTVETDENTDKESTRTHTKTGSKILSTDELFKIWAKNNLKIFEANLSEAQKDTLHLKRMTRLVERWASMTPAQKTDYISQMKSGAEPARYAMTDAWNHSTDLIKDLSQHLSKYQILKPSDLPYKSEAFSEFQSQVMTEFWLNNPDHATNLGNKIRESQQKVDTAIARGTFDELKKQIDRDKQYRIQEMNRFRAQQNKPSQESAYSPYVTDFKNAYLKVYSARLKFLPKEYLTDFFNAAQTEIPKEQITAWTKNLKGIRTTPEEDNHLHTMMSTETPFVARMNRASEAALATTLYKCTGVAECFAMSPSDVKMALDQIVRGQEQIEIISHKNKQQYSLPIRHRKIDLGTINHLYTEYKKDLSDEELNSIADNYFEAGSAKPELIEYLKTYGRSALILFSPQSKFSKEIKHAFNMKFIANMPDFILEKGVQPKLGTNESFTKQEQLDRIQEKYQAKFNFVPVSFMNRYFKEIAAQFENDDNAVKLEEFESKCCEKRTDMKSRGKLAIFPKTDLSTENKLMTLAMEQALADVLYEATGNLDVYSMHLEELCDNIEIFRLVNRFPSETRHYRSLNSDKEINLTLKKRINAARINDLHKEYLEEITNWMNTDVKQTGKAEFEDLLFILNPDENMPEKDAIVGKRINRYGLNLVK